MSSNIKYLSYLNSYYKIYKIGSGTRIIKPLDYGFDYNKVRQDIYKILNNIDYPYIKLFTSSDQIKIRFHNLSNFKCTVINETYPIHNIDLTEQQKLFQNNYELIIDYPDEYDNIEVISDYFNEHCRIKCKFISAKGTVYDYFRNNLNDIINYLERNKLPVDIKNIREAIWNIGYKECSTFKPKLIKYFIEKFKAKRLLDISSGWGDRLIGAMASDIECYHGFDPNPCLHKGYQEMINFFNPKNKNNFIIKQLPFEKATLNNEYYDMVMSSPPYFTMEIYADEETQSTYNINDERFWYDNYLKIWINKCYKALKKNGILALNINQFKNQNYIYWLINDMNNINWKYLGIISHSNIHKKNPQPTFIWSKI